MIRYHASWIVPIVEPPIRDGWVTVDRNRIVAYGSHPAAAARATSEQEIDLGNAAIMPGLVNAHTHLELSHLRHAAPPADEFTSWIRAIMAARSGSSAASASDVVAAIDAAIVECVACGTAVVGDISNTLAPFNRL